MQLNKPLDFALAANDADKVWAETGKWTQTLIARVLERQPLTRTPKHAAQ